MKRITALFISMIMILSLIQVNVSANNIGTVNPDIRFDFTSSDEGFIVADNIDSLALDNGSLVLTSKSVSMNNAAFAVKLPKIDFGEGGYNVYVKAKYELPDGAAYTQTSFSAWPSSTYSGTGGSTPGLVNKRWDGYQVIELKNNANNNTLVMSNLTGEKYSKLYFRTTTNTSAPTGVAKIYIDWIVISQNNKLDATTSVLDSLIIDGENTVLEQDGDITDVDVSSTVYNLLTVGTSDSLPNCMEAVLADGFADENYITTIQAEEDYKLIDIMATGVKEGKTSSRCYRLKVKKLPQGDIRYDFTSDTEGFIEDDNIASIEVENGALVLTSNSVSMNNVAFAVKIPKIDFGDGGYTVFVKAKYELPDEAKYMNTSFSSWPNSTYSGQGGATHGLVNKRWTDYQVIKFEKNENNNTLVMNELTGERYAKLYFRTASSNSAPTGVAKIYIDWIVISQNDELQESYLSLGSSVNYDYESSQWNGTVFGEMEHADRTNTKEATFYFAGYGENDELREIQTVDMQFDGSDSIADETFTFETLCLTGDNIEYVKVFVWDENLTPLCAVNKVLTPEIEERLVSTIPYTKELVLVDNVSTMFNYSNERKLTVLHVNEYPCMEINDVATVIGATVENGTVLKKDGARLKYTAGERLMQDGKGNIIMQVEPIRYNNRFYIPLSSLETTLSYDIKYNRFTKELDIVPFNEPKVAEFIAYAKDYGAVGDGVHDDRAALTKAVDAALKSGKPSKVELESGKTYYLSETMDMAHMFLITGAMDFVFDGKGSTILIEPSQYGFVQLTKSERVRFENFNIESTEPVTTQGWIRGTDASNDTVLLEFEEGYPVLVPETWSVAHEQERDFIMPIQEGTLHPKYISKDYAQMYGTEHIEDRLYVAHMDDQGDGMIPLLEEGDRFVANYGYNNYDLNETSKLRLNDGMFSIATSGEIELRNINITAGKEVGCAVMNAWGNLKFNNFSSYKDGQIWPNGRDFIHTSGVRGTIVFENSKVVGCGDDIINTKGFSASIAEVLGNRKYKLSRGAQYLQGDEVLFVDITDSVVLGRAFVADVRYVSSTLNSETPEITLDREIKGIDISKCVLLNITEGAGGTIVRNNHFENGRRWVWVNRSPNCVFENNTCINNNSSMVAARNSFTVSELKCEGPYPSAFTIRNNNYYCDGNGNPNYDPIIIESDGATFGDTAAIDGLLLEGNVIETSRVGTIMKIADVNELYMINNTIINHAQNTSTEMPVTINNSVISIIDGLSLEYDYSADTFALNIAGCEYDEKDIKNIEILNENEMKPFIDLWK